MSTAPGDKPADTMPATSLPTAEAKPAPAELPAQPAAAPPPGARVRMLVAAALLICWLAWLSFTALTKSREPVVARAQAAVATVPVVALVKAGKDTPEMSVTVEESLKPDGPPAGTALVVANLPGARGFTGEGKYLLLLVPDPHAFTADGRSEYRLVAPPGTSSEEPATIYPWVPEVEAQARRLYRLND